jgi:glutamyl-tRNA reductase
MNKLPSERLSTYIDRIARQLSLSDQDVEKVRAMFVSKGIPLESDAGPYRHMLEEALHNLKVIERNSERARKLADELRESQTELQTRLQEALRRLQAASQRLQEQAQAIRKLKVEAPPSARPEPRVREAVTFTSGLMLVEGPDGLQ